MYNEICAFFLIEKDELYDLKKAAPSVWSFVSNMYSTYTILLINVSVRNPYIETRGSKNHSFLVPFSYN